jgi:hypothetical protein
MKGNENFGYHIKTVDGEMCCNSGIDLLRVIDWKSFAAIVQLPALMRAFATILKPSVRWLSEFIYQRYKLDAARSSIEMASESVSYGSSSHTGTTRNTLTAISSTFKPAGDSKFLPLMLQ